MFANGLYLDDLHGERSKAKNRAAYGIPEGQPAGIDVIRAMQAAQAAAGQTPAAPGATQAPASGDTSSGFLDNLPNKLFGQPTWMLLVGGAIFVMYFFKGSSKGRR